MVNSNSLPDMPSNEVHSERRSGAEGLSLAASHFGAEGLNGEPAVLFAHGFGQTRGAWRRTALQLAAEGYPGLAYDARGHGESARNPAGQAYTGDQFADDLIVLAGELATPPVLVGASMGGLFGLIAESRWPGLFRALVLVDVTPRWELAGMQRILGFMTAFPHGFESLEQASDAIAAYLPHRRNRKSPDELRELLRQQDGGRWHWHWDPRLIDELVRDSAQHQDAIAEAARALHCPVLLISGGRSDLVSDATIADFRALVPHAQHAHLPQATHMLAGDDNDTFTRTVLEYLAQLPPVSASPAFIPAANESAPGARS